MNSLAAFLLAVFYVCLGYGVGMLMSRRARRQEAPARKSPGGHEPAPTLTSEEAADFLQRIQRVTSDVDEDVGRHATRVAEISGELQADDSGGAEVLAATASLLEANLALQRDLAEAHAEIQSQQGQLESYMAQAMTDALTGLANRRGFDQEIARRFAHQNRGGPSLSMMLMDIDHFKRFNDEHGHQAGDAILSQVADVLADTTRQMDFVARYGGEEFGIVLPGTPLEEAKMVAERIRGAVEQQAFRYRDRELFVTLSAGVAEVNEAEEPAAAIARVDAALYGAKQAGRNSCQAHDGSRCVPIEKRTLPLKKKAQSMQRIAPFVDGHFPEPGMFREIDCEELSAVAFTFLSSDPPEFDKVLVALGDSADCAYATAMVHECRSIGTESAPMYRIACRFTAPVDCLAEAAAG